MHSMMLSGPVWLAILGTAMTAMICGCRNNGESRAVENSKPAPRRLDIVVSCDTSGWIVPCGCSSKQAGGLPRRATYARLASADGEVLLADVGGAPGGTSQYDRKKFEYVLKGEADMQTAAHNIGAAEALLGADEIRRLGTQLQSPFVSTNVRDGEDQLIVPAHRIVERGNARVAILGVLSPKFGVSGLKIDNPIESVLKHIATLKSQFDVLLILAYLPEEELEAFAANVPEADLVAGGPTGQSILPKHAGPTLWGAATNKGKFLLHFERPADKGRWAGKIVELGSEYADHESQLENLRAFREELRRIDFRADQTVFSPPIPANPPADFRVAGSDACEKCHNDECGSWRMSGHGRAWLTLLEKESQVDPYCQHCHTTGYGLPGGFTSLATGSDRINVGCETCHGPSHSHAQKPSIKTMYDARDRCISCHDHENSPKFEYASFWEMIAHGEKP
jgi:hypothetical protein